MGGLCIVGGVTGYSNQGTNLAIGSANFVYLAGVMQGTSRLPSLDTLKNACRTSIMARRSDTLVRRVLPQLYNSELVWQH